MDSHWWFVGVLFGVQVQFTLLGPFWGEMLWSRHVSSVDGMISAITIIDNFIFTVISMLRALPSCSHFMTTAKPHAGNLRGETYTPENAWEVETEAVVFAGEDHLRGARSEGVWGGALELELLGDVGERSGRLGQVTCGQTVGHSPVRHVKKVYINSYIVQYPVHSL